LRWRRHIHKALSVDVKVEVDAAERAVVAAEEVREVEHAAMWPDAASDVLVPPAAV
jgi:hypothetical protein